MDPQRRKYLIYGGGSIAVIAAVLVYRSRKAAKASAVQVQQYPVGTLAPNNAGSTDTAAMLALLSGSNSNIPGSLIYSRSHNPPSYYPVSLSQAQRLLDTGGSVYYQAAPGTFVIAGNKLSTLPTGTQLFGSAIYSPPLPGQTTTAGTPG